MSKKITQEEFINRSNQKHNNKYDYSLVNYENNYTKIKIICPEHGVFEQIPKTHLMGGGCKKCADNSSKLTQEEFINKANKIHNNKYNYSLVNYQTTDTKVKIICPEHGVFEQIPNGHLSGYGCKKCANNNLILTQEEFINKAKEIHSRNYDYSLVWYKNSRTKVKIICPKHGVFEQIPNNHLSGYGCSKCSNKFRLNTNIFIVKAKEIHSSKYDYSLVGYKNNQTKVKIICPEHGVFEQTPNSHLSGSGCNKCAINNKKLTKEGFINRCNEIHNNKYDYSLVNYKNTSIKVKIICPEHGVFEQTPSDHLSGCGCKKCADNNLKLTQEEFINRGNEIHNNKYDYSLVNYQNNRNKVKIICPEHGVFEQTPTGHLSGCGCPVCNSSKGEKIIRNFLIDNNISFNQFHTFNDCKHINKLIFDFYLQDKNLCVEYNGLQHYKETNFFNSDLKTNQKRDKIKKEYCEKNNINLIVIKYDEDPIEILKKLLINPKT